MRLGFLVPCLLAVAPAIAAADQPAADALLAAATQLEAAENAGDRIAALTATIRAYEQGLSAMRGELRQIAFDRTALEARLSEEDTDISALLALMQAASKQTETRALLHPGSAVDSIRAGLLAGGLMPELQARADEIQGDLVALGELEALFVSNSERLAQGLAEVRDARTALGAALRERRPLPEPGATDQAAVAALINSASNLAALAESFARDGPGGPPTDWHVPVTGELAQVFGEADAAGLARPGWRFLAAPESLVVAPAEATVRFSGNVPGQGGVLVLETGGQLLIILAGLGDRLASQDDILAPGDALGFLPAPHTDAQDNLNAGGQESSLPGTKTLYIEMRQDGAPIDPATFLTLAQE